MLCLSCSSQKCLHCFVIQSSHRCMRDAELKPQLRLFPSLSGKALMSSRLLQVGHAVMRLGGLSRVYLLSVL
jgi:hypothetical protein